MKLHLASFLSFLKTKKIPTKDDVKAITRSRFSFFAVITFGVAVVSVGLFLSILMHLSALLSVEVPDYGGSITEGVIGAPRYINPLLATSETDIALTNLVYAPLAQISDDGSLTPVLASDCTTSPDEKSYQCTLPEGLVFSDKTPLTAEDVVFTFETKKTLALQTDPISSWGDISVSSPDAKTVIISTIGNAAALREKMTLGIVPKALWSSIPLEALEDSTLNMAPVGAGPFVVKHIKVVSTVPTEVILGPNPKWSKAKPFLRELIVRSFANQLDLKTNLRTTAINDTSSLRGTFVDDTIRNAFMITLIPTNKDVSLFVNQQLSGTPAITRLQGISGLIDRKNIVDTIENGYGIPLYQDGSSSQSTPLSPLSISIAVQKDDDLIATAQILSKELEKFGILSTVNVFDQGLFTDQLHLGQYAFVLTASATPITGYQRLIPLYTKSIVHIASPDIHANTPPTVEFAHESLRDASLWYARTDTIWKWFR